MSADNVIYIKQHKGKFYVWHGSLSDRTKKIPKRAKAFENATHACYYAYGLHDAEVIVEGGVQLLNFECVEGEI